MTLDVLAVGAHPDDADLGVGGTIIKLSRRGLRVGILDLTRGELATRGRPEEREAEAREAARLLGAAVREGAGLPDGRVANDPEQREAVIRRIRAWRPKVLLAPMIPDRHPDHAAAHALAKDANFLAGVRKVDTGQEPHRASVIYYYNAYHETGAEPRFVVDITGVFDAKVDALRAFRSQLYNPAYPGEPTWVASEAFWDAIEARAGYWGSRVGVRYGEPFYGDAPLGLDLPPGLT